MINNIKNNVNKSFVFAKTITISLHVDYLKKQNLRDLQLLDKLRSEFISGQNKPGLLIETMLDNVIIRNETITKLERKLVNLKSELVGE
jgi:hypothetical protein